MKAAVRVDDFPLRLFVLSVADAAATRTVADDQTCEMAKDDCDQQTTERDPDTY